MFNLTFGSDDLRTVAIQTQNPVSEFQFERVCAPQLGYNRSGTTKKLSTRLNLDMNEENWRDSCGLSRLLSEDCQRKASDGSHDTQSLRGPVKLNLIRKADVFVGAFAFGLFLVVVNVVGIVGTVLSQQWVLLAFIVANGILVLVEVILGILYASTPRLYTNKGKSALTNIMTNYVSSTATDKYSLVATFIMTADVEIKNGSPTRSAETANNTLTSTLVRWIVGFRLPKCLIKSYTLAVGHTSVYFVLRSL
ncbi:hypothetical protein P879_00804 [Paragonimus westermani]|uniref:Uncharacterized protein n=1 Tax=Paragonimus westermani TaxID=34504 RepID=A0A8T0DTK5_9TREM|nr:hypothetical protein P879_00804 [Paragonimus westermani]